MRRAPLLALLVLLLLGGCAPLPPQPDSPLAVPAPQHRTFLPVVQVDGWTRRCEALDTWRGSVEAQLASAGEGGCAHIWWTPAPLPEGLWVACRSVQECERLDVQSIAAQRPGAVVLLLNEPNNPDTAGGGWPVAPEIAAARLQRVIAAIRGAGLQAACCGVYVAVHDPLGAAAWMARYAAAGGVRDLTHYHVFGRTAQDARWVMAYAERLWPGRLVISEAGWCEAVKREVRRVDSPRYAATFVLRTVHCEGD